MTWSLPTVRFTVPSTELRLLVEDVRACACDYARLCFTPKAE
jgi:hypothetical protein